MSVKLENFHIESEGNVVLNFKDGSALAVPEDQLADVLNGEDLTKVRKALALKRNYLRRILPPWAKVAVGLTAVLLLYAGGRTMALYGQPLDPRPSAQPLPQAISTHAAAATPPPASKPAVASKPAPADTAEIAVSQSQDQQTLTGHIRGLIARLFNQKGRNYEQAN